MEEFKNIIGFEGYQISNLGNIKNPKGKFLKPAKHKRGYLTIYIKGKNFTLHRLVAIYFIDNPNNYPIINHKDFNPYNNHYTNLEWCTQKYNLQYSQNAGRINRKTNLGRFGKNSLKPSVSILQYDLKMNFIKEWDSITEAGKSFNLKSGNSNIFANLSNRTKSAYGFIWKYK